tara:strand:- start:2470 stop:6396 length:3927 start_codon:yes stop_codon:yes gene_type:complete
MNFLNVVYNKIMEPRKFEVRALNTKNRYDYYRESKNLNTELGGTKQVLNHYPKGGKTYWFNLSKKLNKELKNRNKNYLNTLKYSRQNKVDIRKDLKKLKGTSYKDWTKEIRRLRMKVKRFKPKEKERRRKLGEVKVNVFKQIKENRENREKVKFTSIINKLIDKLKFQEVINLIIKGNKTLNKRLALKFYNKATAEGFYKITLTSENDTTIIALNNTTRDFITQFLMNGLLLDNVLEYGSDTINNFNLTELKNVVMEKLKKPNRIIKNRNGKFFAYINTSIIDLSNYQIYDQKQAYDKKLEKEHCLIFSLLACGVSKTLVNEVKMTFKTGCSFKKKNLDKVALIIEKDIVLHSIRTNGKISKTIFKGTPKGQGGEDSIKIAIHEDHFFKFEETIYSKFFINNYELLKGIKNPYDITRKNGKKYVRKEGSKISSLLLVEKFINKKLFSKLDFVSFAETSIHKELKTHIYLDNIGKEQRLVRDKDKEAREKCEKDREKLTEEEKEERKKKYKKEKDKAGASIYYADCESYVSDKNEIGNVVHKLQLIGFVEQGKDDYVNIFNVCDNIHKNKVITKEMSVVNLFLNTITRNGKKQHVKVYFHNLKYDYHLLEQYVNLDERCEKDNQIYSVNIKYKGCNIQLVDSYKIIPFALSKFQKEFNLDKEYRKKEAISYEYYNEGNNNKRIKTNDYRKLLSYEDRISFDENMINEPSYNHNDKTFNPMEYYKEYLRLDCLVLKKGVEKFETLIKEITGEKMSIYDSLTISSLTDKYMIIKESYEGIYEVKGNLREYISRAVYGGRVCVNKKYKKKLIEGKIADYDGVSLYPSAINRLCREIGLPKGKAKRFKTEKELVEKVEPEEREIYDCWGFGFDSKVAIIDNEYYFYYKEYFYDEETFDKFEERDMESLNLYLSQCKINSLRDRPKVNKKVMKLCYSKKHISNWKNKTYSILTVKINKVNKKQQMPFIAHKNKEGIKYSNEPPNEPVIIDSITLEDYIKFHKIEYEILDGVYWNSGVNKKMGETIKSLFNSRLKAKKEGKKALSNVIKLMLNSSYGKTIMKKTNTKKDIVKTTKKVFNKEKNIWEVAKKTDFGDYVYNNFNTIKSYRKLNEYNYEVESICADNSYNRGHIGCSILSMSKRIMNEVFDIANSNNYPIYYTDTDSLHCNLEDVKKLEDKYEIKYNKKLNGKNLEQFHTDFNLEGSYGEIVAIKSIFLGKKSYLDILESVDKNGKKIYGTHIRLKGITQEGLENTAKDYSNNKEPNYLELYKELSKGTKIKFILNPFNKDTNKNKVLFEFKRGRVSTRKEFIRKVKF